MSQDRKMPVPINKVSFAEAEDLDVEYYAGISWKVSVSNVEEMRRMIWNREYNLERDRSITISRLKDDRDELK